MKVIVNADDFGINPVVTDAVERMIEMKAISSTTIMANGECLDRVKSVAFAHPEISFGVHLCLSEYASLTKSDTFLKYGITDKSGLFVKRAIMTLSDIDDDLRNAIENELTAQIGKVKSLGIPISHCDSHHHIHTLPSLCGIFASVMSDEGIRCVRGCRNSVSWRAKLHFNKELRKWQVRRMYSKDFAMTDRLYSYRQISDIGNSCNGIVELMCHPGHPDEIYIKEMRIVESLTATKLYGCQLISYNDLI